MASLVALKITARFYRFGEGNRGGETVWALEGQSNYTFSRPSIQNDRELSTPQERVAKSQEWLLQIRQTTAPKEFERMASGYRLEIERMQSGVLDYLLRPDKVA